jgi:small conductance mechanosensitive channel
VEGLTDKILEWGAMYGPKVIGALAIFIIGRIVIGFLVGIVKRLLTKSKTDETLVKFLTSLTRTALLAILFIVVLNQLGVQTTSFVAIIGAAGLAIGFALQGSLANFAAGVMLIIFKPFKAGDFVEAGGSTGIVEEVGIFSSIMRTVDNKKIIIPNGGITGGNIVNYSANETRRVDLVFGIGYGDDLKKAKQILVQILEADDRILPDPAPVVAVSELADSSVNFVVRPWVKSEDYWGVCWDLTEKVKLTFDAEGISIPFPQRDVHMHQAVGA